MFRLFKSLNEFKTIYSEVLLSLSLQPNKTPHALDLVSKLGFMFYWLFDNIQILSSIKFLNADPQYYLKLASWSWTIGILFAIAKNVFDIIEYLVLKQRLSSLSEKERNQKNSEYDFLILKTLVDISGKLGDLIVAANGAGIVEKLMGKGFGDGVLGLGGLYAALVSLWNHYLKVSK